MKKDKEGDDLRPDWIELILGNTNRCSNCGQPIDLSMNSAKEVRNQCPSCGSRNFTALSGLEKCLLRSQKKTVKLNQKG